MITDQKQFEAFETYRNWCHITLLGGIPMTDGEEVEVLFPDGESGFFNVKVYRGTFNIREQGSRHGYDATQWTASITVDWHGASQQIELKEPLMGRRLDEPGEKALAWAKWKAQRDKPYNPADHPRPSGTCFSSTG
jgi:hypothetical protein